MIGVLMLVSLAGPGPHTSGTRDYPAAHMPVPTMAPTLILSAPIEHLESLAREPMVVEHPGGALFVSGYGQSEPGPKLWKSRDRGATWSRVDVGSEAEGAIGNSDVDLAVARDGTLYFVTMGFDRKVREGTHIAIGVSRDTGSSWSWTMLSKTRFDDRPWVKVAPDGAAHVIWNDGSGVCHAVSRDHGATWRERRRIHLQGGSSHLAVGPRGEVAVRVVPPSASGNQYHEGVDLIAVSTDGGTTWQKHPAPGERDWSSPEDKERTTPRWVEPIAWDARGALYSLWTHRARLWLARSLDRGQSWKTWRIVEGSEVLYYPYLAAGRGGELAATWFSGWGDSLQAHVARIELDDGNGAVPRVVAASPFQPDTWGLTARHVDPKVREPAGEYLPAILLSDGSIGVVSPVQNERENRFGFAWWRITGR